MIRQLIIIGAISALSHTVQANQSFVNEAYLPPLIPWKGKSEKLIVSSNNPWQTPSEKTGLTSSPSYDDTVKFLKKLAKSDKRLNVISIGKSPQGRDIWMLIANKDGVSDAENLKATGLPTLLVQAGIHSGEIDGKDAGLMLIRDIVHGSKSSLLNGVNLLFVPILSVDGHERSSEYNRVNQRGPKSMGWRTNVQNLNLNRDYAKLDTPELSSLISVINKWNPDLYYDVHVTDGEDYQYDITYGFNQEFAYSPNISRWLKEMLSPNLNRALRQNGHLGGPLVFGLDKNEFSKGIYGWTAGARFSNGYGDLIHLPTILVENHSLKPYKQRVLGTYIFLEETLKVLSENYKELRMATKKDAEYRPRELTVEWKTGSNPELMDFAGIEYVKKVDEVTGISYVQWTGKPKTYPGLPIHWASLPKTTVKIPKQFWVAPEHTLVIERLKAHGIQFETINNAVEVTGQSFEAVTEEFQASPYEGHQLPNTALKEISVKRQFPKNSIKISTDQVKGKLVTALLDPRAPDSFFKWGFFNQIFQRTEYIEPYALIPLINEMVQQNPQLQIQFNQLKMNDKTFAADSQKQLRWFYERSPYYDKAYLKYPVVLEY